MARLDWLSHLNGVSQCRSDRLHQRLLRQDLEDGGLLIHGSGGQVSSGLRHGCYDNSTHGKIWIDRQETHKKLTQVSASRVL